MRVNLKEKPFYLKDEDIRWVEQTIQEMTIEEKIGQLFINLGRSTDEGYIKNLVQNYHIGGIRYTESDTEKVWEQNKCYQKYSKVPVFIAVNCESGGDSICKDGTLAATEAQCGAAPDSSAAYKVGQISGREASALGANWTFSPIVDLLFNWRNTIVNTRAYGKDPEQTVQLAKAYSKGVKESRMLTCAKHFPGDGVEERDQHLLMGINDLSCEEWDASFGKVYKELIDDGLESVMVGHIALPAYSRAYQPDLKDAEILPATLEPNLVNGLLREKLGFRGLVVTDASHMGGLLSAGPRSEQVPGAIAAGCDMFLFLHDVEEDFQYMLEGYRNGVITETRLQEALEHILGMKAKLGLHKAQQNHTLMPPKEELAVIGCKAHKQMAAEIARETVTLVKDTQRILPWDAGQKPRARLYFLESAPVSYADRTDPAKQVAAEELERCGFEVDVHTSFYEIDKAGASPFNKFKAMEMEKVEAFKRVYDVVFVFVHMKSYAQENNVRIKYSAPHSNELAWWVREVPTICISLNYTNHLYDLPMMKTFINAYAPTRECIRAALEKVSGRSAFKGTYNDNVWCGRWDTRL